MLLVLKRWILRKQAHFSSIVSDNNLYYYHIYLINKDHLQFQSFFFPQKLLVLGTLLYGSEILVLRRYK